MPGMGHGCGFHAHGALWQVAAEGQVTRKQGKYMRQLGEVAGGQPGVRATGCSQAHVPMGACVTASVTGRGGFWAWGSVAEQIPWLIKGQGGGLGFAGYDTSKAAQDLWGPCRRPGQINAWLLSLHVGDKKGGVGEGTEVMLHGRVEEGMWVCMEAGLLEPRDAWAFCDSGSLARPGNL